MNTLQTTKKSDVSKIWAWKQRKNGVRGTELRVARSSCRASLGPIIVDTIPIIWIHYSKLGGHTTYNFFGWIHYFQFFPPHKVGPVPSSARKLRGESPSPPRQLTSTVEQFAVGALSSHRNGGIAKPSRGTRTLYGCKKGNLPVTIY